ncbi:MAG: NADP-dependent oxidoreductase [Acidobacteria bacterium]|nr:NADP-dependent oxidoreductase [Acidobacteriota bacterium]
MIATQTQILLAARPEGLPRDTDFKLVSVPIPTPGAGEVLVRSIYLSLDPAMRGWMDDRRSYLPPVQLGEVMRGLAVGEVVDSRDPAFRPGQRVAALTGWQEYAVLPAKELTAIPDEVSLPLALGPLGMTGMTAYFGLLDVGVPQAGETVLVSGAAGAVGSLVGQIAKIEGCRVVGIAGSDDKCRWLTNELGFDAALNYKTSDDLSAALREACPKGVDVYFDNVGGPLLDMALGLLNFGARVVICGAISIYNATEPPPGPANYLSLLVNRARMQGFIVFDYAERYGEAVAAISKWLAEGKIEARHDIVEGLENAPSALLRLFDGSNQGKLMVRVAPEQA